MYKFMRVGAAGVSPSTGSMPAGKCGQADRQTDMPTRQAGRVPDLDPAKRSGSVTRMKVLNVQQLSP